MEYQEKGERNLENNSKMDYDNIISHIGGFGRYQRRIFILSFLPAAFTTLHIMAGVFLSAEVDFRCLLPHENPENATFQLPPNMTSLAYPWDDKIKSWSRCERYDVDLTDGDQYYNSNGNVSFTTNIIKCDAFVYDKTTYALTATTEFNLVCDNAWMKAAADSLLMVGLILGATIFGAISDRYGRRPSLFLALIATMISGFLVAASPEIISYMIFRLCIGASAYGLYLIIYVLVIEMAGSNNRSMVGAGMFICTSVGSCLITSFAYFITNWRFLQIAITIPNLMFLVFWRFIPESTRWLVTMGRRKEAKVLLLKISSENGVELSEDRMDGMLSNDHASKPDVKGLSIFEILKYPNLRRKSLLLFFNWFIISCTYYALSWNTSSLGGNNYINFLISTIVELPAHISVFSLVNKWGRKILLCFYLLISGTSLLLIMAVPASMPWLLRVLTLIGKSGITGSFSTAYIFTAEQYPTVIRNVGVGACSMSARIGGIIAPGIIYYSSIWPPLPFVLLGSGSFIAGITTLLLPETLNQKLPESIKDGEQFGKRK